MRHAARAAARLFYCCALFCLIVYFAITFDHMPPCLMPVAARLSAVLVCARARGACAASDAADSAQPRDGD